MTTNSRPLSDAERAELKMLTSMQDRTPLENDRRNYLVEIHNASALAGLEAMKRAAKANGIGWPAGRRRRP